MRLQDESKREQVCYASNGVVEKTYLIFETGEVEFGFYLFSDDKPWTGKDRCAKSGLVSARLATDSGLHLGQTEKQVISILGRPSWERPGRLVYVLHKRVKLSSQEIKEQRARYPEVSEEEFHKYYEEFDWNAGIELKFVDSKLVFINVSTSETF